MTNSNFRINLWKVTLIILSVFLLFTTSFAEEVESDSLDSYPEKMSTRSTTEWILYAPGGIVHFPLRVAFSGLSNGVGWVKNTKIIERINDLLTADNGLRGVKPTYAALQGAGGLFYQKAIFSASDAKNVDMVQLAASTWEEGRGYLGVDWLNIPAPKGVYLDLHANYSNFTTEVFYGIGPKSDKDYGARFEKEFTSIYFDLHTRLYKNLEISFIGGQSITEIGRGSDADDFEERYVEDIYNEISAPGLTKEVELVHLGGELNIDTKNRPGNPSSGFKSSIKTALYTDAEDDGFGFYKASFDHQSFFHIIYDRVIAIRFAGEYNQNLSGKEIPFYYMAELGSKESIRGYSRNRLNGTKKLLGSFEYRFPLRNIWDESGLDFDFFVDAGQVSNDDLFEDVRFSDIKVAVGGGIRVWNLEGTSLKIELAKSSEMWRFYLVLN
jgi:Omp85 superfamily domain